MKISDIGRRKKIFVARLKLMGKKIKGTVVDTFIVQFCTSGKSPLERTLGTPLKCNRSMLLVWRHKEPATSTLRVYNIYEPFSDPVSFDRNIECPINKRPPEKLLRPS